MLRRPDTHGPPQPLAWPWYPVLIAVWIVLSQYLAVLVDPAAVIRPLLVTAGGAATFTATVWVVSGRAEAAGPIAAIVVLALAARPVVDTLARLVAEQPIAAVVLAAAAIAAAIVAARIVAKRRPSGPTVTRFANVVVALAVVIAVVQAVMTWSAAAPADPLTPAADPTTTAAEHPDIYVLVPDAYPGWRTLERVFDYDNSPFMEALEARGFDVDRESHSNYWFTALTLASMLEMTHVVDAPAYGEIIDGTQPFHPGWRLRLNDSPAFDILRGQGYEIHATDSGWEELTFRSADAFVDSDALNDLELALMRGTYAGDIVDALLPGATTESYRTLVTDAFAAIDAHAAAESTRPRFLLSHLPTPHRPFGFDVDGSAVSWDDTDALHGITPAAMGVDPAEYGRMQLDQIRWLNTRLLSTIDTIMAQSEGTAVILLISDHGPGNHEPGRGGLSDAAALFRNLFASYTPGQEPFESGTTPVEVLSRLFNTYFDSGLPVAPPDTYSVGMVTTQSGALRGISEIVPYPLTEWMREP